MYKVILSCMVGMTLTLLSHAQTLSGKITDEFGSGLPDAYIYTPTQSTHAHSDQLGRYEISGLEANDTLIFSYLGFQTTEIVLTDEAFANGLNIKMTPANYQLDQVYVSNNLKSINQVANIDLKINPVQSSQEVLRRVPGLFIGQHAGGGKAEQIFLRGFDIDHGTDIAITVDGMPVNMVSHAHGQGYADLHFLIPETIENIDFAKGPYYADHGNFNTAGYVDFKTKDKIDGSSVGLEIGEYSSLRTMGMFDLLSSENHNAYIATEYIETDGYFESPQDFTRFNLMGKYQIKLSDDEQLSFSASTFASEWDASGQIPVRLVESGAISRFGAVDDTEGGNTSRTNINIEHTKAIGDRAFSKTRAYYSHYDFELFSNFTFFLENPVDGDQIRQYEDRQIFGAETTIFRNLMLEDNDFELSYGIGFRHDNADDVQLSSTKNRTELIERHAYGDVDETNVYSHINGTLDMGLWVLNGGLRLDYFKFGYTDFLPTAYTNKTENKAKLSPKLNLLYNPNHHMQFYVKSGLGFHSNDSRVVVAQQGTQILPTAYGVDLGTNWKPNSDLLINAAVWYLHLDQEFVYVGDAAIVEPSGRTRRMGVDLGIRYQLTDALYWSHDMTYTHARSIDEPEGADRIPLAPDFTIAGGLSYQQGRLTASWQYRYLKDRPANEDNSIIAKGYFVNDLSVNVGITKDFSIGLSVDNVFDTEWEEAQFATESRLFDEAESVEEIHFTPGTPRFIRAKMNYRF